MRGKKKKCGIKKFIIINVKKKQSSKLNGLITMLCQIKLFAFRKSKWMDQSLIAQ